SGPGSPAISAVARATSTSSRRSNRQRASSRRASPRRSWPPRRSKVRPCRPNRPRPVERDTTMTIETPLQTTPEVGGMGHSVKRKEDPRFIRGKGEYIEDVNLPGQLWLDIVRSPYAHARIKSIDSSEALKIPGVAAVVTGKDLEGYKLHWMPTLAGDMQMVLPVDTVMYQSQEVAAVIATSRYAAADGVAAVMVDYEPLPVITDPHKALEDGAFVLRPDRGPDKNTNHIWHWESGDAGAADAALAKSDVRVAEDIYIPRIHVAS